MHSCPGASLPGGRGRLRCPLHGLQLDEPEAGGRLQVGTSQEGRRGGPWQGLTARPPRRGPRTGRVISVRLCGDFSRQ